MRPVMVGAWLAMAAAFGAGLAVGARPEDSTREPPHTVASSSPLAALTPRPPSVGYGGGSEGGRGDLYTVSTPVSEPSEMPVEGQGFEGSQPSTWVATPQPAITATVEVNARVEGATGQLPRPVEAPATGVVSDDTEAGSTPAPSATPYVRSSSQSPIEVVREWIAASPWPAQYHARLELAVMCESSGSPSAVSSGGYVGLMQVAPWLHGAVPADPVAQLAQAYSVFLEQGWGAWPHCGRS